MRVGVGPIKLGSLPVGAARGLSAGDLAACYSLIGGRRGDSEVPSAVPVPVEVPPPPLSATEAEEAAREAFGSAQPGSAVVSC